MLDYNDLLRAIKKSAVEAVEASKPTAIVFGKVISTAPLQISVGQKLTLGKAQLILSRNVTDHAVLHSSEGQSRAVTVHNGLVSGEDVILVRMQGGQQFVVMDRVGV